MQPKNSPFFLLVFVSTAYIQVDTLPGWLQPVARNQPVSLVTNAVRGLTQGHPAAALVDHTTGYYVLLSLAWCVGIALVGSLLAVTAYRRG